MIKVKTQAEILQEILLKITTDVGTGIATYEHSPAYDIFIQPLTDQVYDANIIADFVGRSSSLDELELIVRDASYQDQLRYALNISFPQVQQFLSATIDNLVSNWNEARKVAQYAKGIIRIYFDSNTAINLSSGIDVWTADGIHFATTNKFINFNPYYDTGRGLYYIDSAIKATVAGISGNIEAGAITNISTTGIQGVVNLERTQFGAEIETDLQLIDRVRTSWRSREVSTLSGIFKKVSEYPGVYDVSLILPGDELQVRNEKNAVDIYLLAEEKYQLKGDVFNIFSARYAYERITDELNYETIPVDFDAADFSNFKFLSQPMIYVSNVSYAPDDTLTYAGVASSNYEAIQDTTGDFAYSVRGHDRLKIENSVIGQTGYLKVDYIYDRLYKDLQNLFKNYDTAIIGADILFKKAKKLELDITVIPTIFTGEYNLTDVKAMMVSDLRIFFEGGTDSNGVVRTMNKLGQKVDKSDLINVCIDVAGVDYIDVDNFTVYLDGVDMGSTVTPLISEYFRLGTVTFSTATRSTIEPITR